MIGLMALLLYSTITLYAQTGTTPEVDYDGFISTFSGLVGGVVLLTEGAKGLFPKLGGLGTQLVSWSIGIVVTMLLWWFHAGFVADAQWNIALLYGLGVSLVANGVADTGLVQWVIGLVVKRSGDKA